MCMCVLYLYTHKKDYEELTHVIMKSGKSQDLGSESTGRRLRGADGLVLRTGEPVAQFCLQAGGLKTQEETMFHLLLKAGKSRCPSLKAIMQEEFSLAGERVSLFVLFWASADWMRPANLMEDNLLYSVYQFKC